ncbi:MAG: hypothetical protein ACRD1R_16565 [Acidobacteriota bacterium]
MFEANPILFRRPMFRILGSKLHGYDRNGSLVLYSRRQPLKLKETIRVYPDRSRSREILVIQARQVLDFSATYDVTDPAEGRRVGALRRKGIRSLFRDEWEIVGADERPLGRIREDSTGLALLRRFLLDLIPQSFTFEVNGSAAGTFRQHFNPFVFKGTLDVGPALDRRLAIAATILLMQIEGRQD